MVCSVSTVAVGVFCSSCVIEVFWTNIIMKKTVKIAALICSPHTFLNPVSFSLTNRATMGLITRYASVETERILP